MTLPLIQYQGDVMKQGNLSTTDRPALRRAECRIPFETRLPGVDLTTI
jgi:hypothetical protein